MFEVAELGQRVDRETFDAEEPVLREALLDAQFRFHDADFATLILINGVDGAGKGDLINRLLEWFDARGIEVHAFRVPDDYADDLPRFYKYWRALPGKGRIAIFYGSWYSEPIINRVLGDSDDAELERSMRRIVDFERMLVDEGVLLLKYWLHVTKEFQKKRFKKFEASPDTAWRVSDKDWEHHNAYDAFVKICAQALRLSSTGHAPWEIVESHDRRFRDFHVARHILRHIEHRLDAPKPKKPKRIPLPQPAEVNIINSLDLTKSYERDDYRARRKHLQDEIGRISRRLGKSDHSVVCVFEGNDAAGKGGAIRRLVKPMDARFYRVVPIAAPTDDDLAHPYLWRFWHHMPRRGKYTIFDRSWYGRVLVERIEGFASDEEWQRAYNEINGFEQQLVDSGVIVIKFWLAISADEQLRRFKEREATGFKRYKITEEDWRNREKWGAYEAAVCEMIEQTSTDIARWHIVPAENKYYSRITVLETVLARLKEELGEDPDESKKNGKKRRGKKNGKK